MQRSTKAKLLTGIATASLAVASLFTAQQREPATILSKDSNIQYTYTDEQGVQVYGVLDDTQALSTNIQSGAIIEHTSMYMAYQDEAPPGPEIKIIGVNLEELDQVYYLPAVMNGVLSWPVNGARSARWIPAPGGVSVGHPNITYGTIGDQVTYNGNVNCFVTNAHVAGGLDGGKVGDRIVQPGPHHGGTQTIGYIVAMVAPKKGVTNSVDVAIVCGERGSVYPGIYGIKGAVSGVYEDPFIGMKAVKCGATSGCTMLTLKALDVTIKIGYVQGRNIVTRTFAHQMMWDGDGDPGDSGSDIVSSDGGAILIVGDIKMAGLLFAGNEDQNRVMGNDPVYILKALPGLQP
jgi:hypothetical protein